MKMVKQINNIVHLEITRGEWLALRGSCGDMHEVFFRRTSKLFELVGINIDVLDYLGTALDDIGGNKHSYQGYDVSIELLTVDPLSNEDVYNLNLSLSALEILYKVCNLALVELDWEFQIRTGARKDEAREMLTQIEKIVT